MLTFTTASCSLDYGQFLVEGAGAAGGSAGTGAAGSGARSTGGGSSTGTGGSSSGGASTGGSSVGGMGGNTPVSCEDQYGDIAEFELCDESATECVFYYLMGNSLSCAAACGARGGECVSSHNDGNQNCDVLGPESCAVTSHNHAICKCTAGCGAGGPCPVAQVCSSGTCM